ncbi:MAG: methyltransferase [Beijerinckiaceae bacterium]
MSRDWRDRRNDLIASPRFQAFAARFPLTRGIAGRRARQAFDLAAGFVYSQILFACVKLRLFDYLHAGPRSISEIARAAELPEESADRLVKAAVSLGLLEHRKGGLVGLGAHGAAFLGNPGAMAMVEHHELLYADLKDPVALLRGERNETELSRYWAYAKAQRPGAVEDAQSRAYSELMDRSQHLVRRDILGAFPVNRFKLLMDVGGGEGGFAIEALREAPNLRATVFDLPPVAARAQARLEASGLAHRARAVGGDFSADALPTGADLISLVRVLHDHDDGLAMRLLRATRAALEPGGTLIVAEPMAEAAGAEAMGDAYFGLYLLAMGSGQPRSAKRISGMLSEAGFTAVRPVPTHRPMLVSVIQAN